MIAPTLELAGVVKRYGDHVAVAGVDLAIAPGAMLALLGPNGAGKSTVVGLAAGLTAPDDGTVRVCGVDPRQSGEAGRLVGLAPQDIGIYPSLTVAQNLHFFGEATGLRRAAAKARAAELAGPMHLDHLMARPAGRLSGGEQRRLHTAIALVHRPPLVLLDEPTAGADVETRSAILDVVRDLAGEGTAVLYTTHYLGEVEELGAEVALLEAGTIIAAGTVDDLVTAHGASLLVLSFTDDAPLAVDVAVLVAHLRHDVVIDATSLTISCPDPAATLAPALAHLGAAAGRLVNVEIVRPSLESAYRGLTGRRELLQASDR